MKEIGLIGKGSWGSILKGKLESLGNLRFVCSGRGHTEYIDSLSGLDWVFIATPTNTHYDIAKICLEKMVNVFCEKPMTASGEKSAELYELSKQHNVHLYVDDVFCFRNETDKLVQKVASNIPSSLYFIYRKYGSFKDTIFNSMTYHDLSILHKIFGHVQFNDLKFSRNDVDYKEFEFNLENTRIGFLYDRRFDGKDKRITIDGETFDYNSPSNDALSEMLSRVIEGEVDFLRNEKMAFCVDRVLEDLNEYEKDKLKIKEERRIFKV